jgi:hypothetical protein
LVSADWDFTSWDGLDGGWLDEVVSSVGDDGWFAVAVVGLDGDDWADGVWSVNGGSFAIGQGDNFGVG